MKKLTSLLRALHDDKSGAAFIEYTALLGVILAVGIGVLVVIGGWADSMWTLLCNQLDASNVGTIGTCP